VPEVLRLEQLGLGLASAIAQTGDSPKSFAQYREFLTLWKNADPDLRPLKEAKAEYKKTQRTVPIGPGSSGRMVG
jgi:hypothetical protein